MERRGGDEMKTLEILGIFFITALVFAYGAGGPVVGYIPVQNEFGNGYALVFGGYGGGGEEGIVFGGLGYGGNGEVLTEDGSKLLYECSLGESVVEKSFEFGKIHVYLGVGFGGGDESLAVEVPGGETKEDFLNGEVEGYLRINRGFFFLAPELKVSIHFGTFEIYLGASYNLMYSIGGWQTEQGSSLNIGKGFFAYPMLFVGLNAGGF
jgi:hypothetical protein